MKTNVLRLLTAMMLVGPMVAQAGLIGDTVGIRYVGVLDTGVQSYVVGVGEEGNFFGNQFFDFGDDSFAIRSLANFCGVFSCAAVPIALQLSSLDFGTPISSVLFSTNLTGVSVAFGSDFATFSWAEQTLTPTTYLSARFVAAPAPVPEPGTLALLGLGLLGLGMSRRKA